MTNFNLPIKRYVIIGSYAMGTRYAKDIDVVCYKADIETEYTGDDYVAHFVHNGRKIECLLADKQKSLAELLKVQWGSNQAVATKHWLWAIKAGHIIFPNRNWEKHIQDYHILRPSDSTTLHFQSFIKLHRESTKERMGIRRDAPKVKGVSKDKFFDDNVVKYYVHDDIHQAMAHLDKPTYQYMQEDHTSVECKKHLWETFTDEWKTYCVLEEAYVIALERHIIPIIETGTVGKTAFDAFKWALMRICTNLCSGWFREYAIENYFNILNSYDPNYVSRFLKNIDKYESK